MSSPNDISQTNVAQCAYFAGFIDGDGMVAIHKKKPPAYYTLQVNAVNTCREPLDLLCQFFGGGVKVPYYQHSPKYRPVWVWSVHAKKAESCLHQLLPFLVIKKVRAELALLFRSTFGGDQALTRGNGISSDKNQRILADRHACYVLMRDLNRKGTGDTLSSTSPEKFHAC